jgi:hypothetical protein
VAATVGPVAAFRGFNDTKPGNPAIYGDEFMRKLLLATAASVGTLLASAPANAQSLVPVAPGTIRIHLNGYLQFMLGDVGGTGMSGGVGTTAYKNAPVGTMGDFRLYPGFDAETINGVDYGVQVELRTQFSNANGAGVNKNSASTNGAGDLYVRRAYGYIGTTENGFVRLGQTDGAFTLLQYGVIEQFGDGGQWTLDGGLDNLLPSGQPGQFIYADQGALYTTDKIVYMTPAIQEPVLGGKFSAIVSYEPNSNGLKEGASTISGPLSELNDAVGTASANRRRNTFDGMVGYTVKLGSFATKVSGGYLEGQPMGYIGTAAQVYAPLQVWQFGAQTTYTGLFTDFDAVTVGANVKGGAVTDSYNLRVRGGRNALAYIVGGYYTNGPYVLGASFFDSQESNGTVPSKAVQDVSVGHTLSEYGVAVGANYIIAKPLSLFVQYMYGNVHGAKPTESATTGPGAYPHGNGHAEGVAAGATFKW